MLHSVSRKLYSHLKEAQMLLGIDFGTCYSFLTIMIGKEPYTGITNPETGIPTVFFRDSTGKEYCGEDAMQYSATKPQDLITELKRRIRDDANLLDEDSQGNFTSGGKSYSTSEVVEKIIKFLVDKAKYMADKQELPQTVSRSVERLTITTPVGLGERKNSATQYNRFMARIVAQVTGLPSEKIHIIEEPKAAALAYLTEHNTGKDQTILVYDLGGGTIDVSIVEYKVSTNQYIIKSNKGNTEIGGIDWDNALAELVYSKGGLRPSTPRDMAVFKKEVIRAKHMLSDTSRDVFGEHVAYVVGNRVSDIRITRQEFETASRRLLEDTMDVVKQALKDYNDSTNFQGVDKIILVGGASQMPQVRERLLREFPQLGNDNIVSYKPSMAISMGAAIWSRLMGRSDPSLAKPLDCASHTYGIECIMGDDEEKRISNIILKDTPYQNGVLTGKHKSPYYPHNSDQQRVRISVYEHDDKAEDTDLDIGSYRGDSCEIAVPYELYSKNKSREYEFFVRLTLKNNIIEIEVTDKNGKVIPHIS